MSARRVNVRGWVAVGGWLAAVALAWTLQSVMPASDPTPASAAPVAQSEDSPGWDCLHQGNHVCGPFTPALGRAAR